MTINLDGLASLQSMFATQAPVHTQTVQCLDAAASQSDRHQAHLTRAFTVVVVQKLSIRCLLYYYHGIEWFREKTLPFYVPPSESAIEKGNRYLPLKD
jgi:hypothetical protein